MDADLPDQSAVKLHALHRVLVRARTQVYLGMNNQTMGRLLDDAEHLTTLIFAPNPSNMGEFRALLQDIEQKYDGFAELTKVYDDAAVGHAAK